MFTFRQVLKTSILSIALVVAVCLGQPTFAQDDTLRFNYQGYLTDSAGDPITDSDIQMTFKIYDSEGLLLSTFGPVSVEVIEGLFTLLVEWADSDPVSEDNQFDNWYLGITIGEDPELTPRTLLTTVPSAFVTKRVNGDISTAPGTLVIESNTDDSAVVLLAAGGTHVIEVYPPDPCVPPDPCQPALALVAEPDNHIIRVHPPEPCVPPEPCGSAFEVVAATDVTTVKLKAPGEDPPTGSEQYSSLYAGTGGWDYWESEDGSYTWTTRAVNSGLSELSCESRSAVGDSTAVTMTASNGLARFTLFNGNPTEPPDVVVRATTDAGGQIGINTDSPDEALDVNGTTKTTGFKMLTDAADGHVLTSDGSGNGTWQAPSGGSSKAACADMVEGMTNSSSQITITFPVTFDVPPYFSVTGYIKSGGQAGKLAHVVVSALTITSVTLTIQYWDSAGFDSIGDSVEMLLSYTAIER